jgi:hypothetical protein
MKIESKDFRVREGKHLDLKTWPTKIEPFYKSKKQCKEMLRDRIEQTSVDTLDGLKMEYPKVDEIHRKELRALRRLLGK